jgi:hypothetical protein
MDNAASTPTQTDDGDPENAGVSGIKDSRRLVIIQAPERQGAQNSSLRPLVNFLLRAVPDDKCSVLWDLAANLAGCDA